MLYADPSRSSRQGPSFVSAFAFYYYQSLNSPWNCPNATIPVSEPDHDHNDQRPRPLSPTTTATDNDDPPCPRRRPTTTINDPVHRPRRRPTTDDTPCPQPRPRRTIAMVAGSCQQQTRLGDPTVMATTLTTTPTTTDNDCNGGRAMPMAGCHGGPTATTLTMTMTDDDCQQWINS